MQSKLLKLIAGTALIAVSMLVPTARGQSAAAKLFKANCALCHSDNGSGNTAAGKALGAKDLRSKEVQDKTDAELVQIISDGKNKMPAFGKKMTSEEITQLVAFIRSLPKGK